MRVRHWRTLLAAAVAMGAVAAGMTVTTPSATAAISDGTEARIVAKSTDGDRFYLMPTGELRTTAWPVDIYTFVVTSCEGRKGVCYEIQDHVGDDVTCMFYFIEYDKIQYDGACGTASLRHKWRIDSLDGGGVRIRPVSHPSRCLVYDPARLPDYLYTFIKKCSSHPESHTRFWFVRPA